MLTWILGENAIRNFLHQNWVHDFQQLDWVVLNDWSWNKPYSIEVKTKSSLF